jgi:hypothetical protein
MGCPTSSPVSNAFMTEFKTDALARYRLIHDPPTPPPISVILFWFRQADDTMTAIHRDHVTSFLAFLNAIHKKIQWTYETENSGRIDMLDLTILRQQDGTLEFDVFRKPTHTNQYINWESDHPLAHKGSTIRSLTRRAHLIPTGHLRQEAELKRVQQALHLNQCKPVQTCANQCKPMQTCANQCKPVQTCALCNVHSVLYTVHSTLCTLHTSLYTVHSALALDPLRINKKDCSFVFSLHVLAQSRCLSSKGKETKGIYTVRINFAVCLY